MRDLEIDVYKLFRVRVELEEIQIICNRGCSSILENRSSLPIIFFKMTPEQVLEFITTLSRISGSLPPPLTAERSEIIRHEIYWWLYFSLGWSITLPVTYDMYLNLADIDSVLLNITELCPLCTGLWKLYFGKRNGQLLRACISEANNFVKAMNVGEREVLQRYIDQCFGLHTFLLGCIIFTTLGFVFSPIFLPQPYPTHTSYPFEVNTELLKNTLRVLQGIASIACGVCVSLDLLFSTLIWIAGVRFELLSEEFRKVSDKDQLCACIRKHQKVMQFAKDVNLIARFSAYAVALSTCIGTVVGATQLLEDEMPIASRIRFASFVGAGCFELLVYSWPAENLIGASEAIGLSVYSSQWVDKLPATKKLVYIVMQRAKIPSIISVGNFLPILSLSFYGSFLSTSFSYFTTLRATTTASSA